MPPMDFNALLMTAIQAALKAGAAILEIYDQNFSVEQKTDNSPLTLADKKSHAIISSSLRHSDIPLLSEEGKNIDFSQRKSWKMFWLVDPLDGTKEFIKKNGEFTVNIALIKRNAPVLGVIFVPAQSLLYFGAESLGARRVIIESRTGVDEITKRSFDEWMKKAVLIRISQNMSRPYTIVGSRSHGSAEQEAYVTQKRKEYHEVELIPAGSSLKFCQVAEGKADEYPRLGTTMEWDTAAGHIIAEQAGARVIAYGTGLPMTYNKEDLKNPWFIVTNGRN